MKKLRNAALPVLTLFTLMFIVVLVSGAFSSGGGGSPTGTSSTHGSGCPNKP